MNFSDIKSFTYIGTTVSVNGVDFEILTPLDVSIDAVQYHNGRTILEEPLMVIAPESKYQYALDEWFEAKRISEVVIPPTQSELDSQAKQKALQDYNQAVEAIIGQVPNTELSSWTKQETEARNITGPTPMIDQLIISRGLGETREVLAAKIIVNADAYAVGYARVLGEYQAKLKAIG